MKGQLMKIRTFKHGLHLADLKESTSTKGIEYLPLPDEVFIALQQHFGAPAVPIVSRGDEVKTGQLIGRGEKYISSNVHSSITGKVKAIDSFSHPTGAKVRMIRIEREEEEEWDFLSKPIDWREEPIENLQQLVRDAGIVGLGGAAFPTHVKLNPPEGKPIDSFVLNGCECEPYLTADHRVMVELPDKIVTGMSIIMKILGVEKGYVGIENNKPDAIEIMNEHIQKSGLDYSVVPLKTRYPQGFEKMLIHAILKRRVPSGGLPMDIGTVVHNVGTAIAVAEAVTEGKPLIQRIVTVTGDAINKPKNVIARIGTPFSYLIDYSGGLKEETTQVFMGGSMMGIAQHDLTVPVLKATTGIICTADRRIRRIEPFPCIRCSSCIGACPMNLMPTRLARLVEMNQLEAAEDLGINNCMECGLCAFVCPSHIPLVQWIRVGKHRLSKKKVKQIV